MTDPGDLYELREDLPQLDAPVLLCSLDGFVDAGGCASLVREQVFAGMDQQVIAEFDVDGLIDYRSRRPAMVYAEDHWESYDAPALTLQAAHDGNGVPFLLLTGPEPDYQWNRFTSAVIDLVGRLDVRLTVSFHGIPMAVPHTRPIGVTAHATNPQLVAGHPRWLNRVSVPGSVAGLLEYRLGQSGHEAMGFAVHVPHYLAQTAYPGAALAAVDAVTEATGLSLPLDALRAIGQQADVQIAQQVEESSEITGIVHSLEEQYDAFVTAQEQDAAQEGELANMPTADEIGAHFERFLAEQDGRRDFPDR